MVKIINQFGDVKKGKQHTAVYQNIYGKQMRRKLRDKKDEHTRGQLEQRARFKTGINFAKGLTKAQRDFIKSYMAEKNIRSPDGLPTTWYSFTKKIAMTRPKVEMETEAGEIFSGTYADWNYRKAITLNNTSGGELTNYQILITLTAENFSYAKCKNDGSDIRFSQDDKTTPLNYWLEDWNYNGTSKIWIKVDSIPTGINICLYIYYGNATAESESNGDNTFLFFDDFPGDSLNGTKWDVLYSPSVLVENSIVVVTGTLGEYIQRIQSKTSYGTCILRTKLKVSTISGSEGLEWGMSDNIEAIPTNALYFEIWLVQQRVTSRKANVPEITNISGILADTFQIYDIYFKKDTESKFYIDGNLKDTDTTKVPAVNLSAFLGLYNSAHTVSSDWVLIHEYTTQEPSVNDLGDEEAGGTSNILSKLVIHHPAIKSYQIKSGETTIKSEEGISNLEDRITTSILAKNLNLTADKIVVKTLANQEYEFTVK